MPVKIEVKKVKLSEIKINPDKETFRQAIYKCKTCGGEFKSSKACKSRKPKYCSLECYIKSVAIYSGRAFICEYCGGEFKTDSAYKGHTPKYCSRQCFGASKSGTIPWNKGKLLSNEIRRALSDGRKKSPKCKGPNLYNWKGGDATFRDRSKIYQNERRARFADGGKIDGEFLRYLWESHHGLCFYCEQPLTDYKCLEHMTPLSKGGKNQPFNFVYSCKSCNSKKRQKTFEDYAIESGNIWWIDKWDYVFALACEKKREASNAISQTIRA